MMETLVRLAVEYWPWIAGWFVLMALDDWSKRADMRRLDREIDEEDL